MCLDSPHSGHSGTGKVINQLGVVAVCLEESAMLYNQVGLTSFNVMASI